MNDESTKAGFTLLEVLLVIGILSAIMYAIYLTFTSTLSSATYVENLSDIKQAGRAFMRILARDLSSAYLVSNSYVPREGAKFVNPTFFIGKHDSIEGREMDRVAFTSLAHKIVVISRSAEEGKLPINQSEHSQISYFVDTNEPGLLFRFDAPRFVRIELDELYGGFLQSDLNLYRYPILENVASFSLAYYDWITRDWSDEWDSTKTGRLPGLVKVTLVLKDASGNEERFFNLIEIPRGMR